MKLLERTVDLQQTRPRTPLRLDRVGVTAVRRLVSLPQHGTTSRAAMLLEISANVGLSSDRMGVHMSRFHELIEVAIEDSLTAIETNLGDRHSLIVIADAIAANLLARQDAQRSDVTLTATAESLNTTPASGNVSRDTVHLLVRACATRERTRVAVGARVDGINACPCAQGLVEANASDNLAREGFSDDQIALILRTVPTASHNQRGTGTLWVGSNICEIDPQELVNLVRNSMSAPIHELLKRDDEVSVVEQAHRNPMFVEDCVRAMIANTLNSDLLLAEDDVVSAHQVNFESIHAHEVEASVCNTVRGFKRDLANTAGFVHAGTTLHAWLANRR